MHQSILQTGAKWFLWKLKYVWTQQNTNKMLYCDSPLSLPCIFIWNRLLVNHIIYLHTDTEWHSGTKADNHFVTDKPLERVLFYLAYTDTQEHEQTDIQAHKVEFLTVEKMWRCFTFPQALLSSLFKLFFLTSYHMQRFEKINHLCVKKHIIRNQ